MSINYDLIALDVDGTLLTENHTLTTAVRDSVREAASRGAEIVLCTGRGLNSALPVLEALGLSGTMITHNGAATMDADRRTVFHQYGVSENELSGFREYCLRGGHHFDVSTAFDLLIESITPEAEEMYNRFEIKPLWREREAPLPEGLIKFTVFGSLPELDRIEEDWSLWEEGLQYVRSGEYFIDVQHREATKAAALTRLAQVRGIDSSRVLAIGNYFNDIGMLSFAGLGVAMANSPEAVKSAADQVTLSNEEDGVALTLRSFAW
ncbi:Cof-type HAD-IIB family hydrolase [Paenibacillus nasutitermitis]|uniref:Sugar phosphate phosphatase n=1 Tax=Paenibacillus nasutitermitis TaxID=1652958 RepID=A0A916YPN8_9BACL|nr:Cof-type HAD-IIB family hydrolase [Paenibacillus nasutitermitis]GGD55240.1 sugar phosphate phosphatase [Paenibacillus nasutitermitis]